MKNPANKLFQKFVLCFFLSSLLLLSACSQEPYIIAPHSDHPMSGDLQVMRDHADYIVIGHYDEFIKAWNMARDLEDSSKESSEHYFEGHIYTFQVEQVIKGECSEETIYINVPYNERIQGEISNVITDERGNLLKEATKIDPYEFEVIREFYMEPDPEERVMLFLRHDAEFDIYFAAIEPYMIALDENDTAELRSNMLLPEEEKEELAFHEAKTEKGKTIIYQHNNLLHYSLPDTVTGMSLQELLEEMELDGE